MSEMVERVARALCINDGDDPDKDWAGEPSWMPYVSDARAAIEAMREPTPLMAQAGQSLMQDFYADFCVVTEGEVAEAWIAMITAALDTQAVGRKP